MLEAMLACKKPEAPATSFLGEVPTSSFIDGASLATALNYTNGTSIYNTEPWLKILHNNKTLYIPKKPIRSNTTWAQLNTANLIYGSRTVVIGGKTYKVRLFTGATADPADAAGSGGEWNAIMYRLWDTNPNGTTNNLAMYTTAQLGQDSSGRFCWCQETAVGDTTRVVLRGNPNIGSFSLTAKTNVSGNYGWRPVLELVE